MRSEIAKRRVEEVVSLAREQFQRVSMGYAGVARFRWRNELSHRIEANLYQIIVYDAGLAIRLKQKQ